MSPRDLVGIADRKGAIAAGPRRRLVVFDPDATFTVEGTNPSPSSQATPYEGRVLDGRVEATYSAGPRGLSCQRFRGTASGLHCWR